MKSKTPMGDLIKKFIDVRGKSKEQVAEDLKINYKTFCGWLNRDALTAEQLFKLATYLDIDLNWMAGVLGYYGERNSLKSITIPRMQDELRRNEFPIVNQYVNTLITENPNNIVQIRNELLLTFNLFYILDVMLPEEQEILIHIERGKERYFCQSHSEVGRRGNMSMFGRTAALKDGKEVLDEIIAERI